MTSSVSSLPTLVKHDKPPAPVRRTYGRARHVTPEDEDDGPAISLFRPTSDMVVNAQPARPPRPPISDQSPAKTLLDRFSAAHTSWHGSLALLDAEDEDETSTSPQPKSKRGGLFDFTRSDSTTAPAQNDDDTDDEEDEEAIKAFMENLRREARGEAPEAQAIPAPAQATLKVPAALGPTTSSSTLSDAPPSSSPSRRERMALLADEETMPIRKPSTAGPSGRPKRIVVSDEDDSDDEPRPTRRNIARPIESDSEEERIPDLVEVIRSDPLAKTAPPAPSRLEAFIEALQEEEDEEAPQPVNSQSSGDPVGLFDDDEPVRKKSGAIKPLNKKEMLEMRRGLERAKREKQFAPSRPDTAMLPMTDYIKALNMDGVLRPAKAIDRRLPGMTRGKSPQSSPSQTTPPDDIGNFTPSSNDIRHRVKSSVIQSRSTIIHTGSSSPTPSHQLPRGVISATNPVKSDAFDEDDDERIPDLREALEADRVRKAKEAEVKAKQEHLARQKADALRAKVKQAARVDNDDDDFEILPDEQTPKPRARFAPTDPPNARAVLHKSNKSPAISKARQDYLRRAGKSTRSKPDLTETYIDYAAKKFDHADQRQANGGARPAGQKAGRDRPLNSTQLNARILSASRDQSAQVRQRKEEEWGKVRSLPEKRQPDLSAFIQASAMEMEQEEVDEDEDEDDDDFVPDDEIEQDVEMADVEEGEASPKVQDDDVHDSESGESHGTDKENHPAPVENTGDMDEDDEETPIIRRRPKASVRIAVDSDDEGEARPRAPLEEIVQAQTPTAPMLDLDGFGDGSPGFSQLFEATQLNTGTSRDGLANLRDPDQPAYLAVNALLPGVDISETQIDRDNAIIAAELEAANPQPSLPAERPRYLNDQGFFTQTKPIASTQPKTLLRRTSTSLGDIQITEEDEDVDEHTPSTTEKGSSVPPLQGPDSPTQASQAFTRLRRRGSSPEVPTQNMFDNPATNPNQGNAFSLMMNASKRREERRQALVNNNLLDEQAEESDEDIGWGLTGGDDEDEEGNDEGYVPDLVDDQAIDEEQKREQDALAAAKAREIAEADDAKREAEAKRITEGHYRTKRRGMDFFSDEEGDELRGGKRRKLTKEERRALKKRRNLDREDGLEKLEGEENAFAQAYNDDLESDEDSTVEDELPERGATRSPTPEAQKRSAKDTWDMLRQRARLNKEHGEAEDDILDREIGYGGSGFRPAFEDDMDTDVEDESQFSISRGQARATASFVDIENGQSLLIRRSADTYAKYVQDESQTTRRANGTAGVSVVQKHSNGRSGPSLVSRSSASQARRPPLRADSSSSGGSILQSRGNKFN